MVRPETFDLGGSLAVNRLGFGAMRITGPGILGEPPDRAAARLLLRRALALGVNLIDTADSYGPEVSENLIAEALHPYPDDLVIATKGGLLRGRPNDWRPDGRPEHLRQACEGSLRRLKVDQIDLYQLHAVDPRVPLEESVGALLELEQQGKIRHVGLCNVSVDELARARRLVSVVSVQNRYSLVERRSEPVLEECAREGIAFIPWFPLANGAVPQLRGTLDRIAAAHGATRAQVALAWLLEHSPVIVPIPGTSSVEHLEENMGARALELADDEIDALTRSTAADFSEH